jgi:CheY-like chemotaxis protein
MDQDNRTLLLVEPSATALFHMGIHLGVLLRRLNYDVETARSGGEALRKMQNKPPRVVVSEVTLPDMTGIELLKRMKEKAILNGIPVVFVTSESDPEIQETCKRLGCSAYLLKPLESETLYRTLQEVSESMPRVNIRLATRLKVIVGDGTSLGGAERMEYATEISVGGLYVSTLYPQPRNALTPIRIFLPDREVTAKGVVLYSHSMGADLYREAGMGMKFVEISEDDRAAIRRFIREQLTSDSNRPQP